MEEEEPPRDPLGDEKEDEPFSRSGVPVQVPDGIGCVSQQCAVYYQVLSLICVGVCMCVTAVGFEDRLGCRNSRQRNKTLNEASVFQAPTIIMTHCAVTAEIMPYLGSLLGHLCLRLEMLWCRTPHFTLCGSPHTLNIHNSRKS